MSGDARRPVLVGVGALQQRESDPTRALEPVDLMVRALEAAADDAGGRSWLEGADQISVPRGMWEYSDPARLVADRIGAKRARSAFAEIGVLQTTLFARAARAIVEGEAEVVLVCGGEAKHRAATAQRAGVAAPITDQQGAEPDEIWRPAADILHPTELARHLGMPVRQYAVIESALRFADGQSLDAHRDAVAALWAGMAEVAAGNPQAWTRDASSATQVRNAGAGNRMMAFPYTKLHCSDWNVDQAAGLIFTSEARARAEGVPESQWIALRAVAESNHMLPLVERRELSRCPGFAVAGRRAFELAALRPEAVTHRELYSCFPAAVRVQQREMKLDPEHPVTVTGGMRFAGGPLNNFVLQAAVRLARVLRADPGSAGLLTAVSGMLTKQGVSLWSSGAAQDFHAADVSEETARETARVEVDAGFRGRARIAGATVAYAGESPTHTIVLADGADGARSVALSEDPQLAERAQREEILGREAEVAGEALVRID